MEDALSKLGSGQKNSGSSLKAATGATENAKQRLERYMTAVEEVSKALSGREESEQIVIHDVIGKVRISSVHLFVMRFYCFHLWPALACRRVCLFSPMPHLVSHGAVVSAHRNTCMAPALTSPHAPSLLPALLLC